MVKSIAKQISRSFTGWIRTLSLSVSLLCKKQFLPVFRKWTIDFISQTCKYFQDLCFKCLKQYMCSHYICIDEFPCPVYFCQHAIQQRNLLLCLYYIYQEHYQHLPFRRYLLWQIYIFRVFHYQKDFPDSLCVSKLVKILQYCNHNFPKHT